MILALHWSDDTLSDLSNCSPGSPTEASLYARAKAEGASVVTLDRMPRPQTFGEYRPYVYDARTKEAIIP